MSAETFGSSTTLTERPWRNAFLLE
jgi:hypothetical protein